MFNQDDVVVCKDNEQGKLSITIDKEYVVLKGSSHGITITNDKGSIQDYLSERFALKNEVNQIKLEVGKTYLTAGGYVVHITSLNPSADRYFTTIECSPGVDGKNSSIHEFLKSSYCKRNPSFKKYGWAYKPNGEISLGSLNDWHEKLRIVKETAKLQPAPKGFRYAGGFPQARSPKQNEWYISCFGGDAIQADKDESKSLIRVIIEKEESKMPPYPPMPAGFKFASDPPEYRKPKKGEWFIGVCDKEDKADADFVNASYYIISKIEEKPSEVYPKYYEVLDKKTYAFRKRISEDKHYLVYASGSTNGPFDWGTRDRSDGDIELTEEVALGRINKAGDQKVEAAPAPKEEVYPKYYETSDRKRYAYRERVNENQYRVVYIDGRLGELGEWNNRGRAIDDVELHKDVAIGRLSLNKIANTPAPLAFTKQQADRPQPRLSYWITEPIGNMFGAAKKSARYVVASTLLAAVGYTAFNPVQTFNFVGSCLPKIHVKFGSEPLKFVPINDIPAVPAEWGNKNVGSP